MTPASARTLLLVVADGVRPDVLEEELNAGRIPTLAALRARGGLYQVSTSFPSVTGPGYVPFLAGRFPAEVGVPGLRWFDRSRGISAWRAHSRSYAGIDIWRLDTDLHEDAPTLFELARPSLAGMSMLGRGSRRNIGRSAGFMLRVSPSHFRGDLDGWRTVEQAATREFFRQFENQRPRFATLAITSPDKRAHKEGPHSAGVRAAIGDIDRAVRQAELIAERQGWRDQLDIWLVGDHGHAPVSQHEDVHGWLEQRGLRVRAHPQVYRRNTDVALMVGGNAMAHIYLEPHRRTRPWWPELSHQWDALHDALLERPAVDLAMVALSAHRVRVTSAANGVAEITRAVHDRDVRWSYEPLTGDPLKLGGAHQSLDANAAYEVSANTIYPDALVQVMSLLTAPRTGDIILSAAEGWDLRSRFEPVEHVSTHGALLRDQMMVPLLVDRPVARPPQRSADVMPSALVALDINVPGGLDGRSFL